VTKAGRCRITASVTQCCRMGHASADRGCPQEHLCPTQAGSDARTFTPADTLSSGSSLMQRGWRLRQHRQHRLRDRYLFTAPARWAWWPRDSLLRAVLTVRTVLTVFRHLCSPWSFSYSYGLHARERLVDLLDGCIGREDVRAIDPPQGGGGGTVWREPNHWHRCRLADQSQPRKAGKPVTASTSERSAV